MSDKQGGMGWGRGWGWVEVQLKDTVSAWKQHTTPDHFGHDAANRPDINWKWNDNRHISMQNSKKQTNTTVTPCLCDAPWEKKLKCMQNERFSFLLCFSGTKLLNSISGLVAGKMPEWSCEEQSKVKADLRNRTSLAAVKGGGGGVSLRRKCHWKQLKDTIPSRKKDFVANHFCHNAAHSPNIH